MNDDKKELLKSIMQDKFSNGAFCGMIFNAYIDAANKGINPNVDELIDIALKIRLRAMELYK